MSWHSILCGPWLAILILEKAGINQGHCWMVLSLVKQTSAQCIHVDTCMQLCVEARVSSGAAHLVF